MGLLTNPKSRAKLSKLIELHGNKLIILSFTAGVLYFLALGHTDLNARTYFSENALLPGLVEADFYQESDAVKYYKSLRDHVKANKENKAMPVEWIIQKFTELGIEVYEQPFNFTIPMMASSTGTPVSGSNVYAILRSPRASSRESIVLSAPYRPPGSPLPRSGYSIALMLAFAKLARSKTYWAKDIIFLVTENEFVGMQAWLDAFHGTRVSEYITGSELLSRSGPIQAALNLEIGKEKTSYMNIIVEGVNGNLPNLDLVNTAVRLCRREMVTPAIHHRKDYWNQQSAEGAQHALLTMSRMLLRQASDQGISNHALFLRYQAHAVTLQTVSHRAAATPLNNVARVVEGVVRSLNNLQERFHQSFFFYLLPATERYVSIGLYMQPFGLIALPLVIKVLMLWIDLNPETKKLKKDDQEEDSEQRNESDSPWVAIVGASVAAWSLASLAWRAPQLAAAVAQSSVLLSATDALTHILLALNVCALLLPLIMLRKMNSMGDWRVLKFFTLLTEAILLGMLSLLNFSLAAVLAVVAVPVSVLVSPRAARPVRLLLLLALVVTSPLPLLLLGCVANDVAHDRPVNGDSLVKHVTDTIPYGLTSAAINHSLLGGSTTWNFLTLVTLPMISLKTLLVVMPSNQ